MILSLAGCQIDHFNQQANQPADPLGIDWKATGTTGGPYSFDELAQEYAARHSQANDQAHIIKITPSTK